jgi:hypothetical protein
MASYGYPRSYVYDRLKKGARIVVAEADGRAVGWKIYQTGEVDQLSWLRVHVPPDMIFELGEFVRCHRARDIGVEPQLPIGSNVCDQTIAASILA